MSKEQCKNSLQPPSIRSNCTLLPATGNLTVVNAGSATGNPRNKCALTPGHSLMDWIRLGNSGVDLTGTGGKTVTVTSEELAKHNTRGDAWMAIYGMVYNVTRYMDFHPGGVDELMRGVGTDATNLFNEVHSWVNYSQLLNKCRIGPLAKVIKPCINKEKPLPHSCDQTSECFIKPFVSMPQYEKEIIPRLDWIQKLNELTLFIYTKQFCNPGSVIRNLSIDDNHMEILILVGTCIHKFDLQLHDRIKWPPKHIKTFTESGKIEVVFEKHKDHLQLWQELGKCDKTKKSALNMENELSFDLKLYYKNRFNKNSYVILFKTENVCFNFPVGSHVRFKSVLNGTKVYRSYTPVPNKFLDISQNLVTDTGHVNFMIKQYEDPNCFSHYLCNSDLSTTLNISLAKTNLNLLTLASHRRICFFAAGSGITPFLSLIGHLLERNINRLEILKLFYFNKTFSDIWCCEVLHKLSVQDERFEFINILSNADETWTGQTGQVDKEYVSTIVDASSKEKTTYIAVCGPSGFNRKIENILDELCFPKNCLYIF